ncbi:MAG: penicillin acylase family protein [Acidobacteriota bacterium]
MRERPERATIALGDPMRRILAKVGLGAAVLALATAVAGVVAVRRSLWPPRSADVTVPGLSAPVEVAFDRFAVPHVRAASVADALAAQGTLHARSRLFQMELARRAASGRLAEMLGAAAVPVDVRMRRWGLHRAAARQLDELDGESLSMLEAYARGVNAALSSRGAAGLAPEFLVLRAEVEPWRPLDSVATMLLLQMDLTDAASVELGRARELRALGVARAADLWGWSPAQVREWIPPDLAAAGGIRVLGGEEPGRGGGASNNWAIAPSRTRTGAPLLANDPHVGVANPSTWYEIHLVAPDFEVAGASFAGAPGVLIGHNADVAWGVTMSMLDDQDAFRLRLDAGGRREEVGGEWLEVAERKETIGVRGAASRELVTRTSRHGPVIREEGGESIAVAWTALRGRSVFRSFAALNRARTVEEAAQSFAGAESPGLNLVCADRRGHIRWQVAGVPPRRGAGAGRLPAPGWDERWEWRGFESFAANPTALDPPSGFVSTANHDPFAEGDAPGPGFPGEFAGPWRVRTIRRALAARSDWGVEACVRLQLDEGNGQARALLELLRPTLVGLQTEPARRLLSWDGVMSAGSREALLWAEFLRELGKRVGGDEAESSGLSRTPIGGAELLRLLGGGLDARWWDDVSTAGTEDARAIVAASLAAAAARAGEAAWGDRHRVTFRHALGGVPLLGGLFDRGPFGVGGASPTVNATWHPAQGGGFPVTGLPSLRFVADLGDWDRSVLTLPLGQSGHPFSPHAGDQTGDWLAGRMHAMPWSAAAVEAATVSRVRLVP